MERWVQSKRVFEGRIVALRTGTVELDDGTRAKREVVEHPGGVCVVPYTGDGVALVRQYRVALGEYVLEVPAGKLEADDTNPTARAEAELEEEAGYRAGRLEYVGEIFSAVGFCSERIHIYIGWELIKTEARPEADERIELVHVPIADVRSGLQRHAYHDAKTAVGLQALLYRLDKA